MNDYDLFDDYEPECTWSPSDILKRALELLADAAVELRHEAPDQAARIQEFLTMATTRLDWR